MRRWLMLAALLLVPVAGQAQTIEYYGLDAIGSVRVVFDANGNVLSRADYTPFGEPLFPPTGKQQQVYAGLFAEGEAGFDYAEARMYQPRTGRFNVPDPVYAAAAEPQRWNRYAYATNNPLTFIDPSGLLVADTAWDCLTFEVATDAGIDTTVRCTQRETTSSLWLTLWVWLDGALGAEGLGGDESELVPTRRGHSLTPGQELAAMVGGAILTAAIAHKVPRLAKGAMEKAAAGTERASTINLAKASGKFGEAQLAQTVGGTAHKYFNTSQGARYVDQLANNVAYEAKTGYTSLTAFVAKQIEKDIELKSSGVVSDVVWIFYRSPTTGQAGYSQPLYNALRNAGITVINQW